MPGIWLCRLPWRLSDGNTLGWLSSPNFKRQSSQALLRAREGERERLQGPLWGHSPLPPPRSLSRLAPDSTWGRMMVLFLQILKNIILTFNKRETIIIQLLIKRSRGQKQIFYHVKDTFWHYFCLHTMRKSCETMYNSYSMLKQLNVHSCARGLNGLPYRNFHSMF